MGLEILAGELEGRLSAIAVLTPARMAAVAGQGEMHGRVPELFRGQRDEPHRRITREQEAAGGGRRCGGGLNTHGTDAAGACAAGTPA